ncbi:hypothetical protein METHP14_20128 [Pseudomonas sp. P14-2025]
MQPFAGEPAPTGDTQAWRLAQILWERRAREGLQGRSPIGLYYRMSVYKPILLSRQPTLQSRQHAA